MRAMNLLAGMLLLAILIWAGPALAQADAAEADKAAPAYEFDLKRVGSDERLAFTELADSGRPFVLFFWISDCPHCKRQLPFVELMYRNMQQYEMEVDVVTINADKVEDQAAYSIRERGIQAPVYWDPDVKDTNYSFDMQEKGTPRVWIFEAGGELIEDFGGFNSNLMVYVLDKLGVDLPRDLAHLKQSK